jgi:hypothetical protein
LMTCQVAIGWQKTPGFCLCRIEGALIIFII